MLLITFPCVNFVAWVVISWMPKYLFDKFNLSIANAGFNGTGYINFNTTGGYLQFDNIDGGAGGTTTIALRYALGATTSRAGTISISSTPRSRRSWSAVRHCSTRSSTQCC